MAQIHLVRHGKAAAGFGSHKDPGLDDLGRQQAEAVAACWMRAMAQRPIYFPVHWLAVQTAQPLAARWQCEVAIETALPKFRRPPTTWQSALNGYKRHAR